MSGPSTESRTKKLLLEIAAGLPVLDEYTTQVWGCQLDVMSKGFQVDSGPEGGLTLLHSCGLKSWHPAPLGVNEQLVTTFDHLLVCPSYT